MGQKKILKKTVLGHVAQRVKNGKNVGMSSISETFPWSVNKVNFCKKLGFWIDLRFSFWHNNFMQQNYC